MDLHSSPSTTSNMNHNKNEYILRVTNKLLSTMDGIEMKLKSFTSLVYPEKTELDNEDCEYQKPSIPIKWECSDNTKSTSIPEEKYPGDSPEEKYPGDSPEEQYLGDSVFTSSCKKECSRDQNSMITDKENQNTLRYETTYNEEHSSKKESSSALVNNLELGSLVSKNYKISHPEGESLLKNVPDIQFHQSHDDNQQPTTVCKSGSDDSRDPEILSATKENPSQISKTAKYHSVVWHMGRKGFVPPKTAPVTKTRKGIPLFAGRVFHQGNLIPATISPENGIAYYTWKGKMFSSNDYEICEIHNFAWEDEGSVCESFHGFPIGRTSDGKALYLGRAYIEGKIPWVGSVDRDEKHIFIPFRGNELRIPQPFEVLITY